VRHLVVKLLKLRDQPWALRSELRKYSYRLPWKSRVPLLPMMRIWLPAMRPSPPNIIGRHHLRFLDGIHIGHPDYGAVGTGSQ
jgi:hypothetical protein